MNDRINDELAWTAFQYASGELDDAATAAFELRLADDPEACEALAEAVAVNDVVKAALETSPMMSSAANDVAARPMPASVGHESRSAPYWWVIATAASIALALAWQQFGANVEKQMPSGNLAQVEVDNHLLAALGPEHRWDAPSPLVDELAADDWAAEIDLGSKLDEVATPELSVAAPDWLLAAVVESSTPTDE